MNHSIFFFIASFLLLDNVYLAASAYEKNDLYHVSVAICFLVYWVLYWMLYFALYW